MGRTAFRGKKALITGAAGGIGRAIALELAREGCDVYLLDVNTEALEDLLVDLREFGVCAVAEYCDLADPHQISHALWTMTQRWGPIDVLVNNAGVFFYGPMDTMSADQWNRLLAINLRAPIQIVSELLPSLKDRPDVYVLNVCSVAGLVAGGGRCTAYQTSKFGLVGFTEALRAEFGRRGMTVTALCPGTVVDTRLYEDGECGRADGAMPPIPPALSTTPEVVARKGLKGLRRNKARVVVSAPAHGLNLLRRFAPGLLDFVNQLGRWRRLRKLRAKAATSESTEPAEHRRAA